MSTENQQDQDPYVHDLCSYIGLRAQAEILNKILHGAMTFSEIRDRANDAAEQANRVSEGRWPAVELATVAPSTLLTQHPAPTSRRVIEQSWFSAAS